MLPTDLFRLPLTLQEEDRLRRQLADLNSENATMGVALKEREAQLNQLNEWLMAHGYGEPDRNTAARVIEVLESRLGVRRIKELTMLRTLLKRIAPMLERKADAGACMHDSETTENYRTIWAYVQEIQAVQKPIV